MACVPVVAALAVGLARQAAIVEIQMLSMMALMESVAVVVVESMLLGKECC
jgi:hypothetical protein